MIGLSTQYLNPGDTISSRRTFYNHVGIYAGHDKVIVLDMHGCRIVTLAEFANGNGYSRVRSVQTIEEGRQVVQRAASQIGRLKYDLLARNCEHFTTWAATGNWSSVQVRNAIDFTLTVASMVIAVRVLSALTRKAA